MQADWKLISLQEHIDSRGHLSVVENNQHLIPFDIQRVFWIYGIPQNSVRGGHAHKTCGELLIALRGTVLVELSDGKKRESFTLSHPNKGLYIPPNVWCDISFPTEDAICLCLASEPYDAAGYIHNYAEFCQQLAQE
ncbi:MAG: FdtA/QdtA family cupin domain-containing protein [Alloprevotella sp.]|nr:FdtA/QdtA family cupin domain-containing protein [Alloprevotella sp.]